MKAVSQAHADHKPCPSIQCGLLQEHNGVVDCIISKHAAESKTIHPSIETLGMVIKHAALISAPF